MLTPKLYHTVIGKGVIKNLLNSIANINSDVKYSSVNTDNDDMHSLVYKNIDVKHSLGETANDVTRGQLTSVVATFDEVVGAREDIMYELEKLRIVGA